MYDFIYYFIAHSAAVFNVKSPTSSHEGERYDRAHGQSAWTIFRGYLVNPLGNFFLWDHNTPIIFIRFGAASENEHDPYMELKVGHLS
jgi:hypothetical protein